MIKSYDLIVILTDHDYLDYEMIKKFKINHERRTYLIFKRKTYFKNVK